MRHTTRSAWIAALLLLCACGANLDERGTPMTYADPRPTIATTTPLEIGATLGVTSTAFSDGGPIPVQYTADGQNISPPVTWSAGPKGTVTYALVMDDPEGPTGTWVHWIAWNLNSTKLDEGARFATDAVQGTNSWKKIGYGGPQPPSGATHHYFIRVYALDSRIELGKDADRDMLDKAMTGHELASGQLVGTYTGKK